MQIHKVNIDRILNESWEDTCSIQFLLVPETMSLRVKRDSEDHGVEDNGSPEADQATAESLLGKPLSDIPEEPSDFDSSSVAESLSMWLQHSHPDLHKCLEKEMGDWNQHLECRSMDQPDQATAESVDPNEQARGYRCAMLVQDMFPEFQDLDSRLPLSYFTNQYLPDVPYFEGPYDDHVELVFEPPMHRLVPGQPKDLSPGNVLVFKITEQEDDARRQVVKRDDDLLTSQQIKDHWEECIKSMMKELSTWHAMKCFSRKKRSSARNIIDTRWVLNGSGTNPLSMPPLGRAQGPPPGLSALDSPSADLRTETKNKSRDTLEQVLGPLRRFLFPRLPAMDGIFALLTSPRPSSRELHMKSSQSLLESQYERSISISQPTISPYFRNFQDSRISTLRLKCYIATSQGQDLWTPPERSASNFARSPKVNAS